MRSKPATCPCFKPIAFAGLLAGLGCGGSAAGGGSHVDDASVLDAPDTSTADVALDAGDGSPSDAFGTPCGPCPLVDADAGAKPTICGATGEPCWTCQGFESSAYCLDGQWLICGPGFGRGCRANAAPPEGTRCCFQDYKPDIIGIGCPNCVGGHHVVCSENGARLMYTGTCADLDGSSPEASGDASSDASSEAVDSASQ